MDSRAFWGMLFLVVLAIIAAVPGGGSVSTVSGSVLGTVLASLTFALSALIIFAGGILGLLFSSPIGLILLIFALLFLFRGQLDFGMVVASILLLALIVAVT